VHEQSVQDGCVHDAGTITDDPNDALRQGRAARRDWLPPDCHIQYSTFAKQRSSAAIFDVECAAWGLPYLSISERCGLSVDQFPRPCGVSCPVNASHALKAPDRRERHFCVDRVERFLSGRAPVSARGGVYGFASM